MLALPGPFERDRLLGLELRQGALDGAWGMIAATGAEAPKPGCGRPERPASWPLTPLEPKHTTLRGRATAMRCSRRSA